MINTFRAAISSGAVKLVKRRLDPDLTTRLGKEDFAQGFLDYLRKRTLSRLLFSPERLKEIARLVEIHDPQEAAWEKEIADNAVEGRLHTASNAYCRR